MVRGGVEARRWGVAEFRRCQFCVCSEQVGGLHDMRLVSDPVLINVFAVSTRANRSGDNPTIYLLTFCVASTQRLPHCEASICAWRNVVRFKYLFPRSIP